jgi:hypothetical protein
VDPQGRQAAEARSRGDRVDRRENRFEGSDASTGRDTRGDR